MAGRAGALAAVANLPGKQVAGAEPAIACSAEKQVLLAQVSEWSRRRGIAFETLDVFSAVDIPCVNDLCGVATIDAFQVGCENWNVVEARGDASNLEMAED